MEREAGLEEGTGPAGSPGMPTDMIDLDTSGEFCFPGHHDADLRGRWDPPMGPITGYALFAHCFTCSSQTRAARRIAAELAGSGIGVLRFDFTGLGESGGAFADSTFSGNIGDLVAAAEWMEQQGMAPTLLGGHSLGGAAVLAAAERLPAVRAVATIGAPASPDHVGHLITDVSGSEVSGTDAADERDSSTGSDRDSDAEGELASVDIGGRGFTVRQDFLTDIAEQPQAERIRNLGRDLLVLHSPTDQIVGVDNARQIFETAKHPKSFMALDGADHLLSRSADAEFVASVIAAWAHRLFPEPDHVASRGEEQKTDEQSEPQTLIVTERAPDTLTQHVAVRTHTWVLDEPPGVGDDLGPTPYDALLGALGGCTSMTMRMYARRKGWDVGASTVQLTHNRVHAKDCDECETTSGMVDQIHRVITLDLSLSQEQQDALLKIADKCPVHRTLTNEVVITTSAAPVPGEQGAED
ncbi:bifunctional alpha/beta hydrolase/OsmC family protein [soil metagenome]